MGEVVQSTVLRPHQFVGYWGFGQSANLADLLTRVLGKTKGNFSAQSRRSSSHSSQASGCTWEIAYLGLQESEYPVPSAAGIVAGVSASGLVAGASSESPRLDAWVTIRDGQLVLEREVFGRSPLYWLQLDEIVWFASRLSLLLPLIQTPELNIPALYGYSCFSYVPTPLTPVDGIFSIAAGTQQTWTAKRESKTLIEPIQTRSHEWRESLPQQQNEATAVTQLQALLKDAVDDQIADLTDEPVGVCLSGGLDSSVIAALLVQAGVKVRAYTLDFGASGISECSYAEQVAEFLNIPIVKVDASPRKIRQALVPTVQALDLPFGDGVTVPLFLLAQAASQETRVIFNGEGGDQLFAGWTNKPLIAAGVYQPEHSTETAFVQRYLRTFHRLWGYESQVFQPDALAQIESVHPQDWLQDALNPAFTTSLLHRLRRATLLLKGSQNIHPRATSLGWAHGLMVRSPFCHLPLAEWTFQVAGALHLQGSCEKYILKRAVEAWLPPEIVWRQKRGMGVPLTSWCLNDLWHELKWLNPKRLKQEGIWQSQLAVRIAAGELGTIQGRRIGEILWLLLMWQVWSSVVLGNHRNDSLNHPFWLPAWLGRRYLQLRRSSQW